MKLRFTLLALFFSLISLSSFATSVEPDSVKINKRLWLYFGWEEDHPKSISVMGGALYSRRPQLPNNDNHSWHCTKEAWHSNSSKPLFFMLSVDGSAPFYPDEFSPTKRKDIHWHLAEGSLPFPVSCWEYNGVKMQITHVGRRILDNSVNAVYTQVVVTNTDDKPHEVSLSVVGESAPERCFFLHKAKYASEPKAIIGRGISDKWILSGKPIAWERVHINGGKMINLQICKESSNIEVDIEGDTNDGNYIIDIPYCVNNIANVKVEGGSLINFDSKTGKVVVSGNSTKIIIGLIK